MKQWTTKQDGLDKLQLVTDAPAPSPESLKDGEVLVKVNRVSINYRDTEGRSRLPHNRSDHEKN